MSTGLFTRSRRALTQFLCVALTAAIAPYGGGSAQTLDHDQHERLKAAMDGAAHSLSIAMSDAGRRGALLHRFTAMPKRRVVPLSDVAPGIEAAESLGRVGGVSRFVLRLPSADKLSAMSTTLGAQNVCVAVDPLVDETAVHTIDAFCGGRRAYLEASVPPDGPVFVIALPKPRTSILPILYRPTSRPQMKLEKARSLTVTCLVIQARGSLAWRLLQRAISLESLRCASTTITNPGTGATLRLWSECDVLSSRRVCFKTYANLCPPSTKKTNGTC
jgi:hypothetical protein